MLVISCSWVYSHDRKMLRYNARNTGLVLSMILCNICSLMQCRFSLVHSDQVLIILFNLGIVSGRLRAAHRDKDAPLMMLFPEGTTTNGDYLLPFKTGAFLSGTPVQPVLLKYTYRRFSPAWDTISGVRHVVLLLCQFINHLEVVWLPVYVPSEKEKADPKLYASNVRKLMADEGCLTLSDIGLPEKRIYHAFLNELLASKSLY